MDILLAPAVLSPRRLPRLTQVVSPFLRASVCQQRCGKVFKTQKMLLYPHPEPPGRSLRQQPVLELLPSHWPKIRLSKTISKNSAALNSPAGVSTHWLHGGFRFGLKSNYYRGAV